MYPRASQIVEGYPSLQRWALGIGVAASSLLAVGGYFDSAQFFRVYLATYLFFFGLTLGSMAVLMIYHTTGGAWGFFVRRPLEAGMRTLPLVAVGFVPIALGLHVLYPWAMPSVADDNQLIAGQRIYMNEPFFYARAIGYFAIWMALAWGLGRWSRQQDKTQKPGLANRLDGISGVGLFLFAVSMHFAAVDWVLALQPSYHSTIFGPVIVVGQILSAYCLAVFAVCLLGGRSPLADILSPKSQTDLGNLLLSFVVVWGYLCWFQYMLSWMANLPYDVVWYAPRLRDGWQWLALALIVFHFFVPLLLLLWRVVKRSRILLGSIAALLLVMHLAFDYYQVVPPFHAFGWSRHWMALVAPLALGGIWLWAYLWFLARAPVLPEYDFNENEAVRLRHSDEEEAAWERVFSDG